MMKAQFEVVILPVSDPDESLRFYRDQVGFDLDVDYASLAEFRDPDGNGWVLQERGHR
jgi:catechol 2,3-dioxygenase-like lactoylglutathione lyase family enzyme